MYGDGNICVGIWNPLLCVLKKDKLVEFLVVVELGIFFVDKTRIAPHVTPLKKSHHNHITTISWLRVPLFIHVSLRYSIRISSDIAPRGSITCIVPVPIVPWIWPLAARKASVQGASIDRVGGSTVIVLPGN